VTISGGTFLINDQRNKLSLADIIFQVEESDTLVPNDRHTTGVTETILSDNGYTQQVKALIPTGGNDHRFVQRKVTRP